MLVKEECKKKNVSIESLRSGSRQKPVSKIRSQLAEKLVKDWGLPLTEVGRHLGVSPSAVAKSLGRRGNQKST
jgi:predicted transcriptional regulator